MKNEAVAVEHVAQRTCVACRQVNAKRGLVRLVRLADGSVEVDTAGKKAGRGTYLCHSWQCWEKGLKGRHVDRALRTSLTEENRNLILEYSKNFIANAGSLS
ncbi:MAG: YlxR family protein [Chloroflexi bacterium]|nr:YlxR family protein [Chloroflexota bacterium]